MLIVNDLHLSINVGTRNAILLSMKNKTIKVKVHEDGSCGWCAVKRGVLKSLDIENCISLLSYQKGDTVYLEEDDDANTLFERAEELGYTLSVSYGKYQKRSVITSYENYRATCEAV